MDFKHWSIENKKKRDILKKKEEELNQKYLDNFSTKKKRKVQYLAFIIGVVIASISFYYYLTLNNIFCLIIFILVFSGITSNIVKVIGYFIKKNNLKLVEKDLRRFSTKKRKKIQYITSIIMFIAASASLYCYLALNNLFCLILFIILFNGIVNDIGKMVRYILKK
ncbi:hypothetical protein [Lactococcus lactis]|uniref:hypothetical protein n=1 Tax=Lactococcus lactis TaxID=1358 RepID=UPI0037C8BAC9